MLDSNASKFRIPGRALCGTASVQSLAAHAALLPTLQWHVQTTTCPPMHQVCWLEAAQPPLSPLSPHHHVALTGLHGAAGGATPAASLGAAPSIRGATWLPALGAGLCRNWV